MLDSGLSIDQVHPKNERRYLDLSSRNVRFQSKFFERRSSDNWFTIAKNLTKIGYVPRGLEYKSLLKTVLTNRKSH